MARFKKMDGYPEELRGRFNSFITTQFDDSLSVEMQLRSLLKWITSSINLINDMVEYLNLFIERFDERMQKEIFDILTEWQETGKLEAVISEALQTQIDDVEEFMLSEFEVVKQNIQGVRDELDGDVKNSIEQLEQQLNNEITNSIEQLEQQLNNEIQGVIQDVSRQVENKKDNREMKVHVFDFALKYSSKCIFVQHNGVNIMIDFGDNNHSVEAIQKINSLGVTSIDYAIITHYHGDHFAGLNNFLNSSIDFSDTIFYLPPTPNWSSLVGGKSGSQPADWQASEQQVFGWLDSRGLTRRFPTEGAKIPLNEHGHMKIYNTSPQYFTAYANDHTNDRTDFEGVDYNNFSLVTEVVNGDRSFVFTGDLGLQGQRQLRGVFKNNIHFYDVEHHGLNHSMDEEFAKQLNPKFAVIQNADDDYSYFSRGMYGYLKSQGADIYVTGLNGDITFTDTVEGTTVETTKGSGSASYGRSHSYSLAGGHSVLPRGTNLDDVMEAGTYVARTVADVNSLSNLPSDGETQVTSAFKLVVDYFHDEIRQRQTLFENSGRGFIWYRVFSTNNQWNPWFRLARSIDLRGEDTPDGTGQHMAEGTDLNDLMTVGKYSAPTPSVGQTIVNKPSEVAHGFTVEVYPLHDPTRLHQIIRVSSGQADVYWRSFTGSWNPWWKQEKTPAE